MQGSHEYGNTGYGHNRNIPPVTVVLVAVNVILFLICTFTGDMLYNRGDLSPETFFDRGEFYRIVSAMFLHADINHIVNNMLLLGGIGVMMEKEVGSLAFALFYFLSGLGGNAVSLANKLANGEWYIESLGASGAVFGLVGALLALSLLQARKMENVTWQRLVFVIIYSLYSGLTGENIDNAAHIGGLCTGFLCGLICCAWLKRKYQQ